MARQRDQRSSSVTCTRQTLAETCTGLPSGCLFLQRLQNPKNHIIMVCYVLLFCVFCFHGALTLDLSTLFTTFFFEHLFIYTNTSCQSQ